MMNLYIINISNLSENHNIVVEQIKQIKHFLLINKIKKLIPITSVLTFWYKMNRLQFGIS
jgi:hypothetical protein